MGSRWWHGVAVKRCIPRAFESAVSSIPMFLSSSQGTMRTSAILNVKAHAKLGLARATTRKFQAVKAIHGPHSSGWDMGEVQILPSWWSVAIQRNRAELQVLECSVPGRRWRYTSCCRNDPMATKSSWEALCFWRVRLVGGGPSAHLCKGDVLICFSFPFQTAVFLLWPCSSPTRAHRSDKMAQTRSFIWPRVRMIR